MFFLIHKMGTSWRGRAKLYKRVLGPYLLKFVLQTWFEDSYFLQIESSKWRIIDLALTLVAFEK